MKHPIYNKIDSIVTMRVLDSFKKNEDEYQKVFFNIAKMAGLRMLPDNEVMTIVTRAIVIGQIMKQGHTLIQANKEDWSSEITTKTLEKLKLKDIKFAFNSGAIVIDGYKILFAFLSKDVINNEINKHYKIILNPDDNKSDNDKDLLYISCDDPINGGQWYIHISEDKYLFEGITNDEHKNLLSMTMAILLYTSMFNGDKNRVNVKTIISKKNSKLSAPKHTTNLIKLTQHISDELESKEGSNWKSEKRWLVRGHMRSQFYSSTGEHKPIWIDPFWKGSGKEEVKKIYKV